MQKLTKEEIKALIDLARMTRENAFAHRSQHKIGASILSADGDLYGGCNVESVISGLGTCAERCAIDHAIAHGDYNIRAICTIDKGFTPSCGACLQYAMLFSQLRNEDIWMINGDINGKYEIEKLSKLLPEGYRTQSNLEIIQSYNNVPLKPKNNAKPKGPK